MSDEQLSPPLPTEKQMENAVERWHEGAGPGLEIYEYFGWSEQEYSDWVSDGKKVQPLRHPK